MEGEDQKVSQTKRLSIWAVIMLILSGIIILSLDVEQASELFDFLTDIIIHLIIG
jgi:hypothetical protein